ncbi:MAG TPA: oligopeptide transporter, OPT family [Rubricoccaceae bacterium]|nr:oligopeptide transporter, OPT family [Rubricoccaceae bacterium]
MPDASRPTPPSGEPEDVGSLLPAGDVAGPTEPTGPVPYVSPSASPAETTLKAVAAGIVFGILFGAANAYLGLRAGLTISTSIPVAVMTVALFRALRAGGVQGTILEANMSQTIGSASSSVASGVIFTLPALFLWGFSTDLVQITLLAVCGGILGTLFMIPLRSYLIVREHANLPYPEGTACAEVLKASEAGGSRAKNVFLGLGIGALFKALTGWARVVPDELAVRIPLLRKGELGADVSAALFGVGYILGPRIAAIMVGGGLLSWLVLIPALAYWGAGRTTPLYPETALTLDAMEPAQIWSRYVRYIGAGAVAMAGLITLAKSIPTMIESFRIGAQQLRARIAGEGDTILRTEQDLSLRTVGIGAVVVFAVLALTPQAFSTIDLALGRALAALLVVVFAFFFVTVSSRIVGLVGVTSNPTSGMTIATLLGTASVFLLLGWTDDAGKVAALTVGAVVAIAASTAGDMSQDLKTGFLLGATPRRQQIGEMLGVLTSAAFVAGTVLLLARAYGFGGEELPAPQATLMKLVIDGVLAQSLPWGLVGIGAAIAIVATLLRLPPLPFAVGVYLPIATMLPVFFGGLLRLFVERRAPTGEEREARRDRGILFGSGLVGGEGLIGVGIAAAAGYAVSRGAEPWSVGFEWAGAAAEWLALALFAALAVYFWRLVTKRSADA